MMTESTTIEVGALGSLEFDAGRYGYTGSAFGPGGFARVDRHRELCAGKRDTRHWHVDYLLGHDDVTVETVVIDSLAGLIDTLTRWNKVTPLWSPSPNNAVDHRLAMSGTPTTIRVLHVDDEPDMGALVAAALEREDDRFDVLTAASPDDGLAVLDEERIDCIVSDYDMPRTNGIEFLEAVRGRDPDLPFILYTGKGSEEVASDAISAGVTDYLQKGTGTDQYALLANRVDNAVSAVRSREALAEHNRRLETLISNLPGIVYRCRNDPRWPMEFVAGECEPSTGYSTDQLESGEIVWGEDVLHPDDRDRMWDEVQAALAADEPFEVTYRVRTADDEIRWMWERGRAIGADDDVIEGFITDVTERREREQESLAHRRELERQNERLEEFASIVSHDLRNPLQVAAARAELLQDEVDSEHLDAIERSHDRMAALIDDLLTLGRQGKTVLDIEPVELAAVARECWETVGTSESELVVEADATVPADRRRLQQLLENLIENAVEHGSTRSRPQADDAVEHGSTSPPSEAPEEAVEPGHAETEEESIEGAVAAATSGSEPAEAAFRGSDTPTSLRIRVGTLDDESGFYVADDGHGIPKSERETVFTSGYSTGSDGTGFGLSIVEQIAEAHGWSVSVTASASGGARFEITDVDVTD